MNSYTDSMNKRCKDIQNHKCENEILHKYIYYLQKTISNDFFKKRNKSLQFIVCKLKQKGILNLYLTSDNTLQKILIMLSNNTFYKFFKKVPKIIFN